LVEGQAGVLEGATERNGNLRTVAVERLGEAVEAVGVANQP
jgi:hypothetical protein